MDYENFSLLKNLIKLISIFIHLSQSCTINNIMFYLSRVIAKINWKKMMNIINSMIFIFSMNARIKRRFLVLRMRLMLRMWWMLVFRTRLMWEMWLILVIRMWLMLRMLRIWLMLIIMFGLVIRLSILLMVMVMFITFLNTHIII